MTRFLFAETFRMGDCLYTAAVIEALKQAVEAEFHVIVSELSGGFDFIWGKMDVQVHRFSFPWEKSGWQFHPVEIGKVLQRVGSELRDDFSGTPGFNPRGSLLQTLVLKAAGVSSVTALEFSVDTPSLWRFLGRDRRNIADSRRSFLTQCARRLKIDFSELNPTFLKQYIQAGAIQNRILLSPGASTPIKFWHPDKWIKLARDLLATGVSVEAIAHSSSNVPDTAWPDGINLFSGGVQKLAERISGSKTVVSPDSFVAHLATAVGAVPVVLFGSQNPELWGPPGAVTVLADDIPCRPCSQKLNRCKHVHRCMTGISVEKVLAALCPLLNN